MALLKMTTTIFRQMFHMQITDSSTRFIAVRKCRDELASGSDIKMKWFLPCDAMHKRGYCRHAVSVCLSVRPSVTFVSCAKTNKDIFEVFTPSGSQAILIFPRQTGWRYSDGNPLTGYGIVVFNVPLDIL